MYSYHVLAKPLYVKPLSDVGRKLAVSTDISPAAVKVLPAGVDGFVAKRGDT